MLLPVFLVAQENYTHWLTEEDGLPTKAIEDIDQDENGNIILGSYLGLTIYDGKNFTTKTIKDGLPNTSVGSIIKDSWGNLWIRSYSNKLSTYKDGKIAPIKSYNKDIYRLKGYGIYFISDSEMIADYVLPFKSITHKKRNGKWIKTREFFSTELRVPMRNPNNRKEVIGFFDYELYSKSKLISFEFENKKEYKIKSENFNHLFTTLSSENREFISIDNHLFEFGKGGIKHHEVFDDAIVHIYEGIDNTLWLGFANGGVSQVDKDNFGLLSGKYFKEYVLSNFLQDMEGGMWFCTKKGLAYISYLSNNKWRVGENFASNLNTSFFVGDTLFLGHTNGDVGYIVRGKQEAEKIIYEYSRKKQQFIESSVIAFIEDLNGDILFSNQNLGVYKINRKTMKVTHLFPCSGSNSFYKTPTAVYCALHYEGVLKITKDKVEKLSIEKRNTKAINVLSVYTSNDSEFLLGCSDGLWKSKDSVLTHIGNRVYFNESTNGFVRLSEEALAITTCGAGITVCTKTDTVNINSKNGLLNDCISSILLDDKNRLWAITASGVSIIYFESRNNFRKFVIKNISGNEWSNYENYSIVKDKGLMYITSSQGVLPMDPETDIFNRAQNSMNITKVAVSGKQIVADSLLLEYKNGLDIEIGFRQNNFQPNTFPRYFYRLKNYSDNWVSTLNESVIYESLPPGAFVFEVYAESPYSKQKSFVKAYPIIIKPKLWQKSGFKITIIAVSVCIVFLFFGLLLKKVLKREKERANIKVQIAELESKFLRSQMNPHFVFNSLNSIQSFVLKNDSQSAHYFLGKFSKLMRDILENTKADKIPLKKEIEMLNNYLDLERMRCDNSFEYKITIAPEIALDAIKIPGMFIQPIVENAIVHGVNSLIDRAGQIQINFTLKSNTVLNCVIKDNGIGRKASEELKKNKSKYHESMGVSISQERIGYYNRSKETETNIEIIDLYDEKGNSIGTQVTINLPILK